MSSRLPSIATAGLIAFLSPSAPSAANPVWDETENDPAPEACQRPVPDTLGDLTWAEDARTKTLNDGRHAMVVAPIAITRTWGNIRVAYVNRDLSPVADDAGIGDVWGIVVDLPLSVLAKDNRKSRIPSMIWNKAAEPYPEHTSRLIVITPDWFPKPLRDAFVSGNGIPWHLVDHLIDAECIEALTDSGRPAIAIQLVRDSRKTEWLPMMTKAYLKLEPSKFNGEPEYLWANDVLINQPFGRVWPMDGNAFVPYRGWEISNWLTSPDPQLRATAAITLGDHWWYDGEYREAERLLQEQFIGLLIPLVDDMDAVVRREATIALMRLLEKAGAGFEAIGLRFDTQQRFETALAAWQRLGSSDGVYPALGRETEMLFALLRQATLDGSLRESGLDKLAASFTTYLTREHVDRIGGLKEFLLDHGLRGPFGAGVKVLTADEVRSTTERLFYYSIVGDRDGMRTTLEEAGAAFHDEFDGPDAGRLMMIVYNLRYEPLLPNLIAALEAGRGGVRIAQMARNSGHTGLEAAAIAWAKWNGYSFVEMPSPIPSSRW